MNGVRFNDLVTSCKGKLDTYHRSVRTVRDLKLLCTKTLEGPQINLWGRTRTGLTSKVMSMVRFRLVDRGR